MQRKSFDVETKAEGDAGEFTALVSVFGNVDRVGDRVQPGAFTKTLRAWREKGDPLPIVLSHRWDDPHAHIGIADPADVKQTKRGLLVKGTLDIGDNDIAKQVYRLMKRRSLKSFSFGYTVPEGGEEIADDGVNDLTEISLHEVGPTLVGANPEAELQAIKSALGETKSSEHRSDQKDSEVEDASEEPAGAKPPAQDPLSAQVTRARLEIALGHAPNKE